MNEETKSGWRKRQVNEVYEKIRNDTLEEVAKEIEKMTVFGKDTIDSFASYIRGMKKFGSMKND
jgi:predicted ThiF/HesA family dinucleotide-utilizing enzyme